MTDLLKLSHIVSKNLQSKTLNIAAASIQVQALISEVSKKRSDKQFEEYWNLATTMANSIDVEFIEKRPRKTSRILDENAQNETILDSKKKININFFSEAVCPEKQGPF